MAGRGVGEGGVVAVGGGRVVITTPTTLFALLNTLAYGWQQANVTENARKIAEAGKELYESFAPFIDHWNNLGNSLNKASESFNKSVSSLQSRILPKARSLKTLGVSVGADVAEIKMLEAEARNIHIPELTTDNNEAA